MADEAALRQLARRADEHAAFARVARRVAAEAPPEEVLALVAEEVATLLDLEVGTVARFDDDSVELVAAWTQAGSTLGSGEELRRVPLGLDGLFSCIHASDGPARIDDYADLNGEAARLVKPFAIRSSVGAPIRVDGRLWGAVVALSPRPRAVPRDAEERLVRFAELVDLAITNAANRATLESRAATDPLTGLANKRTFDERLTSELERSRRHGRPLALAMLDLDHFKGVNDRHGHDQGDHVLSELARRLALEARPGDLLARVGGEEFAWLLPEANAADAWAAAERARDAVARRPFDEVGFLTLSAGVADTADAIDAASLYAAADRALYAAKAHGRNACFRHAADGVTEPVRSGHDDRPFQSQVESALRSLARTIDARHGSRGHSDRVGDLAAALATALGRPIETIVLIRDAALVHDVGKVGVDPSRLLRADAHSDDADEPALIHPALGAQMVGGILTVQQAAWIRAHHERFDGLGHPDGLAGEEIPLEARILAVAEAWDGLTRTRPGREPLSHEQALSAVRAQAGSRFCPDVVTALTRLVEVGAPRP
ncbi:MAG: diguanylate cyclase [Thermoleophilia bacterium]